MSINLPDKELLLQAGAETDGIYLYGKRIDGSWRFRAEEISDGGFDEEGFMNIERIEIEKWYDTLIDAFKETFFPWNFFTPFFVSQIFAAEIFKIKCELDQAVPVEDEDELRNQ
jgi:hypothetical protein